MKQQKIKILQFFQKYYTMLLKQAHKMGLLRGMATVAGLKTSINSTVFFRYEEIIQFKN